jgi:dihydrofolate reductase
MKDSLNDETAKVIPAQRGIRKGLSLIAAVSENNVIGKDNRLLWNLPNDMKFFKNTTWGMPVIMGRKTFNALNKPLPGRINIVVTRHPDWKADGVVVASDLPAALIKADETNCKEVFIIGGGDIYRQSIDMADKIYLTRVHAVFEGDTLFPGIDTNKWALSVNDDFPVDEKHTYSYSFQVWVRK